MTLHKTVLAVAAILLLMPQTIQAQSLVEPSYDPSEPRIATPWYETMSAKNKAADMAFIIGMRPHHAGALSMSEDYLNDPNSSNNMLMQLSRGIIQNQTFEISMLDRIETYLNAPQQAEKQMRKVAAKGLAQEQVFYRAPMPGPLDAWAGDDTTTVTDVKFAKAMIFHHEAALIMCDNYLENPDAINGYLRRMCLDILKDQSQEIAFMHTQKNKYPGNVDDIELDLSMVHGMDDMMHSMGHGHHMGH